MLPDLRQADNYDCGDTIFRVVCQHHGWTPSAEHLSTPIDGTDPRTLEAAFHKLGRFVRSGTFDLEDLQHFTDKKQPVICLVQYDGTGHYVAVHKVNTKTVHLHCPIRGPIKSTRSQFLADWHDLDRFSHRFHQWGIAPW